MAKYDHYIRKDVIPILDLFKLMDTTPHHQPLIVLGEQIKRSQRIQLYKEKGYKCVACGISASYFAIEKTRKDLTYHLNLYCLTRRGEEVMMTQDHIIPKSKGGADRMENLQPMCDKCNCAKGDKS